MPSEFTVEVQQELRALLPGFLARRQRDVAQLETLLAELDFGGIRLVGHNMKGVGGGYGFLQVSALGARLEDAAQHGDAAAAAACIADYQRFLSGVNVVFV